MNLAPVVSARLQGVLGTFVSAVEAFNNNDWALYKTFLDQNVVAYNITSLGFVTGRDNVANYFQSISDPKLPSNLQFVPTNIINWFPPIYPLSVYGIALWTHAAHGHIRVRIQYDFQFSPGDSFLLTSVWAEHSEH
jgi:hypothetical protein